MAASPIENEELDRVTRENLDRLADGPGLDRWSAVKSFGVGAAVGAVLALWPFVAAYGRGRITAEQLEHACRRVVGDSGVWLCVNLVAAAALGPVYLWFALARTVARLTTAAGVDIGGGGAAGKAAPGS